MKVTTYVLALAVWACSFAHARGKKKNGKSNGKSGGSGGKGSEPAAPAAYQYDILYFDTFPFLPDDIMFRGLGVKRNLKKGNAQDAEVDANGERKLGGSVGYTFIEWMFIVNTFFPGCALAPVRNTEELALIKSLALARAGTTPTLVGVYKNMFEAIECQASGDDCLEGWMTFFGEVDEDPALWTSGQPDGDDASLPSVASIANVGGNAATMYDNSVQGQWEYAAIMCEVSAEVQFGDFPFFGLL